VRTGWTSDLVLKQTKGGGFPSKLGTFGPFEIGSVGVKHPDDSDHAECLYLLVVMTMFRARGSVHIDNAEHEVVLGSATLSNDWTSSRYDQEWEGPIVTKTVSTQQRP